MTQDPLSDPTLQELLRTASARFDLRPRIAIVGVGKAGKSTLFNALFGQNAARVSMRTSETTTTLTRERLGIELTDSPGFGTRDFGIESVTESDLLGRQHVVLHLFNGVGAITDDDVQLHIALEAAATHRISAVNKADLLNGQERKEFAQGMLEQIGLREPGFCFISARMGGGVENLVRRIADALPMALRDAFLARQQASMDLKDARARALIYSKAVVAAAVAAIPIPVADVVVILPLQLAMVAAIGALYGVDVSWRRAIELLTTVGAGVGLREAARQLVKLVPGWGSVVSAAIAFSGTVALGEVAILLFKNEVGLDPDELRRVYEAAADQARKQFGDHRTEVEGAAQQIDRLRSALDAGTLTQAEYQERLAALGGGS